jgi:hypothetical protein
MNKQTSSMSEAYVLGHSKSELRRLARQGAIFSDLTLDLLRRAGIKPGMRVLDVGCGAGDVSLIVAELVGRDGQVVGIDRSPDAIAAAQRRTVAAQIDCASFSVSELDRYTSDEPYDAIVGRLVLLYQPDPAASVRAVARCVRPGGVIAFQEMVMSDARSIPLAPLYQRCIGLISTLFERVGFPGDMGLQLLPVFLKAGLPKPSMTAAAIVDAGPGAACHPYLVETLRTILPVLEGFQITSAAEVDIDTLESRLRNEAEVGGQLLISQLMIGAWSRLPE